MSCRLTLILFWTLLSLCGTGAERLLVSGELEDFRARYETDFELISKKLRQVSGRLKLTTLMNDEKGRFVSSNQDTGTFAISGPLGKCVLDVKRTWVFLTFQHSYVYGKLDDTAFTLSKRKGFSSYSMDQYDTPNQAGQIKPVSPLRFLDYQMNCERFWTAPYLFYSNDWRTVLDSNRDLPTQIEQINSNGKPLVRISYDTKGNNDLRIEIDLDPAAHHRIVRSGFVAKKSGRPVFQYLVEYEGDSVVPSIVTYDSWQQKIKCEFTDLRFEPTPAEEFQPAFFGIPDIHTATGHKPLPYGWVLVMAVAGVFVYLAVRRSQRRFLRAA